jgi:hypothetical protein
MRSLRRRAQCQYTEQLEILEVEAPHPEERIQGGRTVYVDLNTGQLSVRDGK